MPIIFFIATGFSTSALANRDSRFAARTHASRVAGQAISPFFASAKSLVLFLRRQSAWNPSTTRAVPARPDVTLGDSHNRGLGNASSPSSRKCRRSLGERWRSNSTVCDSQMLQTPTTKTLPTLYCSVSGSSSNRLAASRNEEIKTTTATTTTTTTTTTDIPLHQSPHLSHTFNAIHLWPRCRNQHTPGLSTGLSTPFT